MEPQAEALQTKLQVEEFSHDAAHHQSPDDGEEIRMVGQRTGIGNLGVLDAWIQCHLQPQGEDREANGIHRGGADPLGYHLAEKESEARPGDDG